MATKTINLTGAEVAVTGLDGTHAHQERWHREIIFASKATGTDKSIIFISVKNREILCDIILHDYLYFTF